MTNDYFRSSHRTSANYSREDGFNGYGQDIPHSGDGRRNSNLIEISPIEQRRRPLLPSPPCPSRGYVDGVVERSFPPSHRRSLPSSEEPPSRQWENPVDDIGERSFHPSRVSSLSSKEKRHSRQWDNNVDDIVERRFPTSQQRSFSSSQERPPRQWNNPPSLERRGYQHSQREGYGNFYRKFPSGGFPSREGQERPARNYNPRHIRDYRDHHHRGRNSGGRFLGRGANRGMVRYKANRIRGYKRHYTVDDQGRRSRTEKSSDDEWHWLRRCPSRDSQRDRSPSRDNQRDRSPSRDNQRDRSPSRDNQRDRSPSRDNQRDRSPSRDNQRDRSPSRDNQRDRSPSRDNQRDRSPSRDNQRDRSPSRDDQRERNRSSTRGRATFKPHHRSSNRPSPREEDTNYRPRSVEPDEESSGRKSSRPRNRWIEDLETASRSSRESGRSSRRSHSDHGQRERREPRSEKEKDDIDSVRESSQCTNAENISEALRKAIYDAKLKEVVIKVTRWKETLPPPTPAPEMELNEDSKDSLVIVEFEPNGVTFGSNSLSYNSVHTQIVTDTVSSDGSCVRFHLDATTTDDDAHSWHSISSADTVPYPRSKSVSSASSSSSDLDVFYRDMDNFQKHFGWCRGVTKPKNSSVIDDILGGKFGGQLSKTDVTDFRKSYLISQTFPRSSGLLSLFLALPSLLYLVAPTFGKLCHTEKCFLPSTYVVVSILVFGARLSRSLEPYDVPAWVTLLMASSNASFAIKVPRKKTALVSKDPAADESNSVSSRKSDEPISDKTWKPNFVWVQSTEYFQMQNRAMKMPTNQNSSMILTWNQKITKPPATGNGSSARVRSTTILPKNECPSTPRIDITTVNPKTPTSPAQSSSDVTSEPQNPAPRKPQNRRPPASAINRQFSLEEPATATRVAQKVALKRRPSAPLLQKPAKVRGHSDTEGPKRTQQPTEYVRLDQASLYKKMSSEILVQKRKRRLDRSNSTVTVQNSQEEIPKKLRSQSQPTDLKTKDAERDDIKDGKMRRNSREPSMPSIDEFVSLPDRRANNESTPSNESSERSEPREDNLTIENAPIDPRLVELAPEICQQLQNRPKTTKVASECRREFRSSPTGREWKVHQIDAVSPPLYSTKSRDETKSGNSSTTLDQSENTKDKAGRDESATVPTSSSSVEKGRGDTYVELAQERPRQIVKPIITSARVKVIAVTNNLKRPLEGRGSDETNCKKVATYSSDDQVLPETSTGGTKDSSKANENSIRLELIPSIFDLPQVLSAHSTCSTQLESCGIESTADCQAEEKVSNDVSINSGTREEPNDGITTTQVEFVDNCEKLSLQWTTSRLSNDDTSKLLKKRDVLRTVSDELRKLLTICERQKRPCEPDLLDRISALLDRSEDYFNKISDLIIESGNGTRSIKEETDEDIQFIAKVKSETPYVRRKSCHLSDGQTQAETSSGTTSIIDNMCQLLQSNQNCFDPATFTAIQSALGEARNGNAIGQSLAITEIFKTLKRATATPLAQHNPTTVVSSVERPERTIEVDQRSENSDCTPGFERFTAPTSANEQNVSRNQAIIAQHQTREATVTNTRCANPYINNGAPDGIQQLVSPQPNIDPYRLVSQSQRPGTLVPSAQSQSHKRSSTATISSNNGTLDCSQQQVGPQLISQQDCVFNQNYPTTTVPLNAHSQSHTQPSAAAISNNNGASNCRREVSPQPILTQNRILYQNHQTAPVLANAESQIQTRPSSAISTNNGSSNSSQQVGPQSILLQNSVFSQNNQTAPVSSNAPIQIQTRPSTAISTNNGSSNSSQLVGSQSILLQYDVFSKNNQTAPVSSNAPIQIQTRPSTAISTINGPSNSSQLVGSQSILLQYGVFSPNNQTAHGLANAQSLINTRPSTAISTNSGTYNSSQQVGPQSILLQNRVFSQNNQAAPVASRVQSQSRHCPSAAAVTSGTLDTRPMSVAPNFFSALQSRGVPTPGVNNYSQSMWRLNSSVNAANPNTIPVAAVSHFQNRENRQAYAVPRATINYFPAESQKYADTFPQDSHIPHRISPANSVQTPQASAPFQAQNTPSRRSSLEQRASPASAHIEDLRHFTRHNSSSESSRYNVANNAPSQYNSGTVSRSVPVLRPNPTVAQRTIFPASLQNGVTSTTTSNTNMMVNRSVIRNPPPPYPYAQGQADLARVSVSRSANRPFPPHDGNAPFPAGIIPWHQPQSPTKSK